MEPREVKNSASDEFEEFIAYDSQGRGISLHKSIEHPADPNLNVSREAKENPKKPLPFRLLGGNLRFFADVNDLSHSLRRKIN